MPTIGRRAKVNDYCASPAETEKISGFRRIWSLLKLNELNEVKLFSGSMPDFQEPDSTAWVFEKVERDLRL
jgi:hypothetical protein